MTRLINAFSVSYTRFLIMGLRMTFFTWTWLFYILSQFVQALVTKDYSMFKTIRSYITYVKPAGSALSVRESVGLIPWSGKCSLIK